MTVTTPITGGCVCGAVRYESSAEPMFSGICCCRNCQYMTGTGQTPVLAVPNAAFRVTKGTPRHHEVTGDSGKPVRHSFCGDCGSPLFGQPAAAPFTGIKVGSLDDPSIFKPGVAIYTELAHSWVQLPDVPKFPKMPPR
jgi:hypothetical protein